MKDVWDLQREPSSQQTVQGWNRLADREHALTLQVLAEPDRVGQLRQMLADPGTSEELRGNVEAMFALDTSQALEDPEAFRNHPLVNLSAEQLLLEPSLVLVETEFCAEDEESLPLEEGRNLSRSGGLPTASGRPWPCTQDGAPLEFLVQVDLGSAAQNIGYEGAPLAQLGLPVSGILQLFYDMASDVRDIPGPDRGTVLRWVPEEALSGAVRDTSFEPAYPAQNLIAEVAASTGYPGKNLTRQELERLEYVGEVLEAAARHATDMECDPNTVIRADHVPVLPSSRLRGLGHHESTDEVRAALDVALPLESGDRHVIVFDVAGNRNLEGAFGDCGHLQVWMRASDLVERDFTETASMYRSD